MKIQTVIDYVFEIAPNPPFGDENIYEFGDGTGEVTGLGVAWWITSPMLEDFVRKGYQLGLSHERVIYDVPQDYLWGTPCTTEELETNQNIARLAHENGITIHRFHSNLDLVEWGMPKALFRQLGWENCATDWSRGVPVVEIEPIALGDLIAHVKSRLKLPFVRYDGDLQRVVRRIGVPWGGLCQWWTGPACVAPLGFDVLMGGDIIDGVVRLAREQDWAVMDVMHHATELAALEILVDKLRARFPELSIEYYENSMPWAVA